MVTENIEAASGIRSTCATVANFRDNVEELRRVLIATPTGRRFPSLSSQDFVLSGPSMIRDEDGALTGYVYIDLNTKDYGGFVTTQTTCSARNSSCRALHVQVVRRI